MTFCSWRHNSPQLQVSIQWRAHFCCGTFCLVYGRTSVLSHYNHFFFSGTYQHTQMTFWRQVYCHLPCCGDLHFLLVYAMFCLKLRALCVHLAANTQAGLKTLINNRVRFDWCRSKGLRGIAKSNGAEVRNCGVWRHSRWRLRHRAKWLAKTWLSLEADFQTQGREGIIRS